MHDADSGDPARRAHRLRSRLALGWSKFRTDASFPCRESPPGDRPRGRATEPGVGLATHRPTPKRRRPISSSGNRSFAFSAASEPPGLSPTTAPSTPGSVTIKARRAGAVHPLPFSTLPPPPFPGQSSCASGWPSSRDARSCGRPDPRHSRSAIGGNLCSGQTVRRRFSHDLC